MSHFYGKVWGRIQSVATRCGHKSTGLTTQAASYQGAVEVTLSHRDGVDWALVSLIPWKGRGVSRVLYEGPVGEYKPDGDDPASTFGA